MVFGSPNELYDPDSATRLLHSAGDQYVSVARSNLLQQGVLSKLVRDPKKPKPGRMLKISDTYVVILFFTRKCLINDCIAISTALAGHFPGICFKMRLHWKKYLSKEW